MAINPTVILTCCGASIVAPGGREHGTNDRDGWITMNPCEHDDSVQVFPPNDTREHVLRGGACWCEKQIIFDNGVRIVKHQAVDGRE